MLKRFLIPVLILLSASITVFTQNQSVYQCPGKYDATNSKTLRETIQQTNSVNKSIVFLTEDNPCSYSKDIKSKLNATINKNLFSFAAYHSFSLIKFGDDFFSIEQFTFKTEKQANLINRILMKQRNNMLKSEGVSFYDYFWTGNKLIFYIADGQIYQNNLSFFQNFKENFLANNTLSEKSK